MNKVLDKILGTNGNSVQAYAKEHGNNWIAQQDGTEPIEHTFTRNTLSNNLPTGAWPFDCEQFISCSDLPYQTCGCTGNGTNQEKRGIIYNIDSDSKLAQKVDYKSCEELKIHGVSIRGYFIINGARKYCGNWGKYLCSLTLQHS